MKITDSLEYRYTGSGQEIICAPEAISGIGGVLDRLGAKRAMVVCGPSILSHSDVVPQTTCLIYRVRRRGFSRP